MEKERDSGKDGRIFATVQAHKGCPNACAGRWRFRIALLVHRSLDKRCISRGEGYLARVR